MLIEISSLKHPELDSERYTWPSGLQSLLSPKSVSLFWFLSISITKAIPSEVHIMPNASSAPSLESWPNFLNMDHSMPCSSSFRDPSFAFTIGSLAIRSTHNKDHWKLGLRAKTLQQYHHLDFKPSSRTHIKIVLRCFLALQALGAGRFSRRGGTGWVG